jgi:hypothetical protein
MEMRTEVASFGDAQEFSESVSDVPVHYQHL